MVKKKFDHILTEEEIQRAQKIIEEAHKADVQIIINVATSLIESNNCIRLAQQYPSVFATVGIHPNDATSTWRKDFHDIALHVKNAGDLKIVGIGECGIDRHYPQYNLQRQIDVFKAHINLALEHNRALVVHTRDAEDETYKVLEEYHANNLRGVIHCFSGSLDFARAVIPWGFLLGVGGTITYPKNDTLRSVVKEVGLQHLILETDAPYLPPQIIRGKENSPAQIAYIAEMVGQLFGTTSHEVAHTTTAQARLLFNLD